MAARRCRRTKAGFSRINALCEERRDGFAWSAPCRPEVDGYEGVILREDGGVGVFAFEHGDCHCVVCESMSGRQDVFMIIALIARRLTLARTSLYTSTKQE